MKNLLLAISVTTMLVGTLCAGTNPLPAAHSAQTIFIGEASSLVNPCGPGDICSSNLSGFSPGDGSPMPVCPPGKNCNNDQLQLRAGDGSPMPVCPPGKNCNNDQFQLRAGDGSPMPVCPPGKNCNNDQFRLTAGDGSPITRQQLQLLCSTRQSGLVI